MVSILTKSILLCNKNVYFLGISFKPFNKFMQIILLRLPIHRWGNRPTERFAFTHLQIMYLILPWSSCNALHWKLIREMGHFVLGATSEKKQERNFCGASERAHTLTTASPGQPWSCLSDEVAEASHISLASEFCTMDTSWVRSRFLCALFYLFPKAKFHFHFFWFFPWKVQRGWCFRLFMRYLTPSCFSVSSPSQPPGAYSQSDKGLLVTADPAMISKHCTLPCNSSPLKTEAPTFAFLMSVSLK